MVYHCFLNAPHAIPFHSGPLTSGELDKSIIVSQAMQPFHPLRFYGFLEQYEGALTQLNQILSRCSTYPHQLSVDAIYCFTHYADADYQGLAFHHYILKQPVRY